MTKKYRLITFCCYQCGSIIKVLIRKDGSLIFSIIDKLHSSKDVLTDLGYYVCVDCHYKTKVRFEYIFN